MTSLGCPSSDCGGVEGPLDVSDKFRRLKSDRRRRSGVTLGAKKTKELTEVSCSPHRPGDPQSIQLTPKTKQNTPSSHFSPHLSSPAVKDIREDGFSFAVNALTRLKLPELRWGDATVI